jgi:uncharacterized protein (DUF488 family)
MITKSGKPVIGQDHAQTKMKRLFTVGYEQATSPAVLGELQRADVGLVVDTRAVAASRRPGFSKRQLASSLDAAGIGYLHLQKLGTPKEGRDAARSGNLAKLFDIYERHLGTLDAREQLDELTAIVKSGRPVCLLCYERDVAHCHRKRIAELICERTEVKVEHLAPPLF